MTKEQIKTKKVAREVAINDLRAFLKIHLPKQFKRGKLTDEKIEDDYINVIDAIEDGDLIFDDHKKPIYTLVSPIRNNEGDISISSINFRARIKGADKTVLMNGIDPNKQLGDYMIKVISYITQLESGLVKKLDKEDFEVLNQICSVF